MQKHLVNEAGAKIKIRKISIIANVEKEGAASTLRGSRTGR